MYFISRSLILPTPPKEYFQRWDAYDVDAALAALDDDDEEEVKEKPQERKQFHRMTIEEVDESSIGSSSNVVDTEEEDIEEIYTPDALAATAAAAAAAEKEKQHAQTTESSTQSMTFSANLKAQFSSQDTSASNSNEKKQVPSSPSVVNDAIVVDDDSPQDTATPTKNIGIVETACDEEEFADEPIDSSLMSRVDIVCEDTACEDEDDPRIPPSPEQIQDSNKLKQEGNVALKEQRYEDAIKFYSLALDINPDNTAALNNKNIAHIKMEDWKNTMVNASLCLAKDVTNTKALYHRGYALMKLENRDLVERYKEALVDFEYALSLQPPKDQISALRKKIDLCNKVLSSTSMKERPNEKKKVRTHDTQGLAF